MKSPDVANSLDKTERRTTALAFGLLEGFAHCSGRRYMLIFERIRERHLQIQTPG